MANINGKAVLEDLIASRREGYSMPQEFYTDAAVHSADVERIFRRRWVFVGHSCQVKEAGELFTVTIGGDPSIIIHGDDGVIRTLHNVCRHRGTLNCRDDCGKTRRLVCPYHQWPYERDGWLASCRGMHEINRDELGLLPELKEMPRHGCKTACCGAGGSRMWFDNPAEERIGTGRITEALDTGTETVAVSCPFCLTMMTDGVSAKDDLVKVRDNAELMAEENLNQP